MRRIYKDQCIRAVTIAGMVVFLPASAVLAMFYFEGLL